LLKVFDLSNTLKPKGPYPELKHNSLRPLVIRALARTGGDRADVVMALRAILKTDEGQTDYDVARALASPDISIPGAIPALAELRHDKNLFFRVIVVQAIVNQTPDREQAIMKLLEEFASDDPAIQTAAAIALGEFGTSASSAAPALRNALDDAANSIPNAARGSSGVYVNQEDWFCGSVASAVRWALARIEAPVDKREP
jgi:hypothetical protein